MEATLYKLNNSEKCGGYTHFLQLKAAEVERRAPIHIIAVIDISGSMQFDNKLTNVKESLKAIIEFMTTADLISIITFSKNSNVIAKRMSTNAGNKYILKQKIDEIDVDCSTNLSSGLISAFECQEPQDDQHKTSIILLTDGEANEGITNPDSIIELIGSECSPNVNIYTFGYGTEHNSGLLSMIAEEQDGAYNVVNSLDNVASAIGNAFGSIASCFAQNIVIEGAEFYSGFPATPQGGVRVGDMAVGGETGVLVKNIGELEIKGYNVHNGFEGFSIKGDAIQRQDGGDDTDKAAYITYMRIKLAGYIEKIPADGVLDAFEAGLEGDDEIIEIMRKEVQQIRNKKSVWFTRDLEAIQTQHANFYRNLRSEYRMVPERPGGDSRGFNVLSPVARSIGNSVFSRATRAAVVNDGHSDPSDNMMSMHSDSSVV